MPSKLSFALAVALMAAPPLSSQSLIHGTFGPGDAFDPGPAYIIGSLPSIGSNPQWVASSFLYSGASTNLLNLRVAGRTTAVTAAPLFVQFLVGGSIGTATALESWSLPATSGAVNVSQIFAFNSLLNPTLTAGNVYWVMLSQATTAGSGYWGWNFNSQGLLEPLGVSQDMGSNWFMSSPIASPAYDLYGTASTAVPEPGTVALLATGLVGVGLFGLRRRRNQATGLEV